MPIVEDDVKRAMKTWLTSQGYLDIEVQLGTRQGYDVECKHPISGKRFLIECKGEATTGNQHRRSWPNVASAILTSLNETEKLENINIVGMAFPDTKEYRNRMSSLQVFRKRQSIFVFWVAEDDQVTQW